MEIIGKPGEEVWVKAQMHLIKITEGGIDYYVKIDGQVFKMEEGDIIAAAPKIIREPVKIEEPQRIEIPDTPADRVHELVKKDDLKRRRTK